MPVPLHVRVVRSGVRLTRNLTLCLLVVGLLGGCGADEDGDRSGQAPRPVPALPPVPLEARARFALDRLLQGPLPRTGRFPIPDLHLQNLDHAQRDLVALPRQAAERLTDPRLPGHDPWHAILDVLAAIGGVPTETVLLWTEGALEVDDIQLQRRAARLLSTDGDARSISLLFEFLTRHVRDRVLGPTAARVAVLGPPWLERVLDVILREGTGALWQEVPELLARGMPPSPETVSPGEAEMTDALAWWALLAESSGPGDGGGRRAAQAPSWLIARLRTDDVVWPRAPRAFRRALLSARFLLPASIVDDALPASAAGAPSPVLAPSAVLLTGKGPAATARCMLAGAGYWPYEAAVHFDLAAGDELLYATASHCTVVAERAVDYAAIRRRMDLFGSRLEARREPLTTGVLEDLLLLEVLYPEEARRLAWSFFRQARPPEPYLPFLEGLYEFIARGGDDELVDAVRGMLRSQDGEDVHVASHLIRRARDPRYLSAVEQALEAAAAGQSLQFRRLLIWLYSSGAEIAPSDWLRFIERYERWVRIAPDEEAVALAGGLLDFGEAGAAAFVRGLEGERRQVYVQALAARRMIVPQEVAAALLQPLDAATSAQERRAILVACYRSAPANAADDLAAARDRLTPDQREEVEDVLMVLRHRAPVRE
ncbi:MAG: hypothetical protein ACYTG6_07150 [Planctomycetota bacterium]|jgi:hypothetical protein